MVIVTKKVGQLCNRLFHFGYFITNSIEFNYRVIYLCFDEYSEYFIATSTNNFLNFPISLRITRIRIIDKLLLKVLNCLKFPLPFKILDISAQNVIYDLKSNTYQNLVHSKILIVNGWLFKDEANLKKHRDVLRQLFRPKPLYEQEVAKIISDLRNNFDCVVGIHIRRGDYQTWNNGKYFFTDEVYLKRMEEFKNELEATGKKCGFFLCSNDTVDIQSFSHLDIRFTKRHFITDLYTLAECDYIIGPPSTFNLWASFYGDVPLFEMSSKEAELTLDKFISC